MDDDSFEDSFESSSDSDTQQDIVPAYTEREDLTQAQYSQTRSVEPDSTGGRNITLLHPKLHTHFEPESGSAVHQQHG